MASLRSLFLALPLSVSLLACGGGDGDPTPTGEHYTYVGSKAYVPTNNNQARDYGLDLNADGTVDNQLGMVLGTLATQGNFDIQGGIDEAVLAGDIILLMDFQTPDFTTAAGAGLAVKLGDKASASPAPCTDPANPTPATCGKHLEGTGTFSVSSNSPTDAVVVGKIASGTFNGGPGEIAIQIALGGDPVNLNLIGARAKATGLSAEALGEVILAGAIPEDDLNNEVLPAIQQQLAPVIAESCPMPQASDCGCPSGSGRTILNLFDTAPRDCMVSLDEIKNNSLIKSLLAPDVTIDGTAALSLGIKLNTKKATF